jgi:hypothetical protein
MEILTLRSRAWYAAAGAIIFIGVLTSTSIRAADGEIVSEYALKAAYLLKFGLFVEWPKEKFASPTSTVLVCVAGDDQFGDALDRGVQGERIDEHPILVRHLKLVGRDSGCDILYTDGSHSQSVPEALSAVNGMGVLTVADAAHDDHTAAIVDFVVQGNRVRFNINEQAASQNGITISSHLLSLALSVKSVEPQDELP